MHGLETAQSTGVLHLGRDRGVMARLRGARTRGLAAARRAWSAPLELRFLVFSVVVLVSGALVIGGWTSGEIKNLVIQRAAATNALYVDSFVSPLLQSLERSSALPPESVIALDSLLTDTALGERIVSYKIWTLGGKVVYATDDRLLGQAFSVTGHQQDAADGQVSAHISNLDEAENQFERLRWSKLLETYAPVRSHETGGVIAVSEFYQLPDEILSELRTSQIKGWIIVAIATLVMFLILNGMVRQASVTIRRQNAGLRRLTQQVRAASASNVQTEEQVMGRIAQDLHDAPAQNLAVALLRLDHLSGASRPGQQEDWALLRQSVESALADLRNISSGIRIPDLEELDADAIISRAVADFSQRTGRAVSCRTEAAGAQLSVAAKATTYRIIQEALNNSFLHGQAATQTVSVSLRSGWLEVEVTDDGIGFDPDEVRGRQRGERARLGIRGMRERAELLGGSLSIESQPGSGTRVNARIPEGEEYIP